MLRVAREIRIFPLLDVKGNSSTYAVAIYEKLDFRRFGNEEINNGTRYVPMRFSVGHDDFQ
jgi:hypothetical protein